MTTKILITGPPGCGKTTLLKEVILDSKQRFAGFFTGELRGSGQRVGFEIEFLDGGKGLLARKGLDSKYRVGAYGVDLERFENLLEKEKLNILSSSYVVIDEIGKMELFSDRFRRMMDKLLDSDRLLLGAIIYKPHLYADSIKKRADVRILYMERKNYNLIKTELENAIKSHSLG